MRRLEKRSGRNVLTVVRDNQPQQQFQKGIKNFSDVGMMVIDLTSTIPIDPREFSVVNMKGLDIFKQSFQTSRRSREKATLLHFLMMNLKMKVNKIK